MTDKVNIAAEKIENSLPKPTEHLHEEIMELDEPVSRTIVRNMLLR